MSPRRDFGYGEGVDTNFALMVSSFKFQINLKYISKTQNQSQLSIKSGRSQHISTNKSDRSTFFLVKTCDIIDFARLPIHSFLQPQGGDGGDVDVFEEEPEKVGDEHVSFSKRHS